MFKTHSPIFLAFSIATLAHCNKHNAIPINDLQGVLVTENLPILSSDGKSRTYKREIRVFSTDSFSVYEIPYISERATTDNSISNSKHFDFFVVKKADSLGFIFDSKNIEVGKWVKKDSIFSKIAFTQIRQFKLKIDDGTLIIKDSQFNNSHSHYLYMPRQIVDASYPDSVIFYYDKTLNNYRFSLIPDLDSIYNSKLYLIRFITNKRIDPNTNVVFEPKEMSFKFEVLKSFNKEDILNIVASYKEHIRKNPK
jgi:hypothetical protein